MGDVGFPVIFVLLLVLAAEFVNAWTDAPNAIATVISTRVLSPHRAVLMASALNIVGALSGTAVAATMGLRLTKLEPVHGFATETSAAVAIELASRLGIPLSTTHTISTAIIGVGATRRLSAVRWGVGSQIVLAWILTFPVCGLAAWLVALGLGRLV